MSDPRRNNIGAFIAAVSALVPLGNLASTRNSAAIDRGLIGNPQSCTIICHTGAVTGAPSAQALDVKLQDSTDGSTGWADVTGAAFAQKTTGTGELRELDVNLAGTKQFVRIVEVTGAFTGGTSPTLPNGVSIVFGGANKLPA